MNPPSSTRTPAPPANPPAPRLSFWQRRVIAPLRVQLTQGITPEKLTLTVAIGVPCGLFPIFGLTTMLCFLVAYIFRLNQAVIHVINQVLWPVHLTMIIVYVRLGAWLFHAPVLPFDLEEIRHLFFHAQREFWSRFGLMGLQAAVAWLLTVPVFFILLYLPLRPLMRRLAPERPAKPTRP